MKKIKTQRKKSLGEIFDQQCKLYYECLDSGNKERAKKILCIWEKYKDNINRLPEQQDYMRHTDSYKEYKENHEKRCSIKYRRKIYARY